MAVARAHGARARRAAAGAAERITGAANSTTAREQVDRLLDPGSAFREFSALAANGMYDDEAPSAGIITGIRIVNVQCAIVASDATVKVARTTR